MRKKILDVVKVGFYGDTGDNRSPEDFCFPACMVSLMQHLGEDCDIKEGVNEYGQAYYERVAYARYLAATGMAFGLLWSKEFCLSSMDLTQINQGNTTINNAFRYAGYEIDIIVNDKNNKEFIMKKVVESINNGIPVLAFGIIGPPECLIISGYDDNGETVIGYSHFQNFESCEKEPNGMFRKNNWYENLWKIVLCGKKTEKTLHVNDIYKIAYNVLSKTESDGYVAGLKAYDEWIQYVLNDELTDATDELLKVRHEFHHMLIGNLAEARWNAYLFFKQYGNENGKKAGLLFKEVHDTCWKVWQVLGEYGQKDVYLGFRDKENRKKIAHLLEHMKDLDEKARDILKLTIE